MVKRVENGRHRRERAPQTQQERDESEVADRRIGQQPFEVLLEDRRPGADEQGGEPRGGDDEIPKVRPGKDRPEADEHENARLQHRRRMKIGRNGSRRRHGVGKREVASDRKSGVEGKSVSGRVDRGGGRSVKKNKQTKAVSG